MSQFPSSSNSPVKLTKVRRKRVFSPQAPDLPCICTDAIVPIDPRHETLPGDVEMREQGQEDGATPPVLSPFPSAEGDHDQPIEEGAACAHGVPNGVNRHIVEEEDSKIEDAEDVKEPRCPPLPLPLEHWRKVRRGRILTPTSQTHIWLLRTNLTPQRGRGSIRVWTPVLSYPYVIFITLCILCFVDLDVLINSISCV